MHMGVIFDPTVRYVALASVLCDILLSAVRSEDMVIVDTTGQ